MMLRCSASPGSKRIRPCVCACGSMRVMHSWMACAHACMHACRYEDAESQPGCPLAVGVMLQRLAAHTTDDLGNEAFVTDRVLALLRKVRRACDAAMLLPS